MNKWATLYNQLVRKHNKTRKKIIKRQQAQDREDSLMRQRGIMPPRRNAKVTPMKYGELDEVSAKEMNEAGYKAFKSLVEEWGSNSELEFYKTSYKDNYLNVLRESMIGEEPDAREIFGGKYTTNKSPYSKEQIEECEDFEKKQLMRLYNQIYYMSTEKFMALYENGYIVKLSYIYHGVLDGKEQDFYDEQQAFIQQAKLEGRIKTYGTRRTRREQRNRKSLKTSGKKQNFNKTIAKTKYKRS